jgi:hypothetical protein
MYHNTEGIKHTSQKDNDERGLLVWVSCLPIMKKRISSQQRWIPESSNSNIQSSTGKFLRMKEAAKVTLLQAYYITLPHDALL